jgi:long-chain acyl-CoA synthetase
MPYILRKTVSATFLERIRTSPNLTGFRYKSHETPGEWQSLSFRGFFDECRLVSFGMMNLGLAPADKVAIVSTTRYEWPLADLAILGARGITVPIYPSNTPEDIAYILAHSEAKLVFLEDARQLQKILDLREKDRKILPGLKHLVVFDPTAMSLLPNYKETSKDVMTLQALKELGKREETRDPQKFENNLLAAGPDDPITICYTSGTTGVPKGVILTQDNMMSVLEDVEITLSSFAQPEAEVVLSFLPVSHIFGKVESMAVWVTGWQACFAESIEKVATNLTEIRPTLLFSVPRIYEKAYAKILSVVDESPPHRKALFHWGVEAGRRYFAARRMGKKAAFTDFMQYRTAHRAIFGKVRERFGGRLRYAVSGGAPLAPEIGEFFRIAGIPILEGYGLTETTGPVSINTPDDIRFGTVGRPLTEVSMKIAEDGELLVKSRKNFSGYYKEPNETDRALEAGWFHTGDIGFIDEDGFVHITDRKKDLIVTSAGKNIAPQKIENLAKSHPLLNQFVVHGDRRHYLTALVTLDRELVIRYASENQILFSEYAELIKNPKILSWVEKAFDDINRQLASYETVKKFTILPQDFTIDAGELTPSMKLRRSVIERKYREQLDRMYDAPEAAQPQL